MISDRIKHIISHFGLTINSFSKAIGLSNNVTIGRIINENRSPSYDIMCKILQTYGSVDANWLLLGQGNMLRSEQIQSEYSTALPEVCEPKGSENYTADVTSDIIKAKNEVIRSKDELLIAKDKIIETLEYRLELAENYQPSKRNSA